MKSNTIERTSVGSAIFVSRIHILIIVDSFLSSLNLHSAANKTQLIVLKWNPQLDKLNFYGLLLFITQFNRTTHRPIKWFWQTRPVDVIHHIWRVHQNNLWIYFIKINENLHRMRFVEVQFCFCQIIHF